MAVSGPMGYCVKPKSFSQLNRSSFSGPSCLDLLTCFDKHKERTMSSISMERCGLEVEVLLLLLSAPLCTVCVCVGVGIQVCVRR